MGVKGISIWVFGYLCLYLLTHLIKFLYKTWWTPIHIQKVFRSQGISGPSYKFHHGNTKEMSKMIEESKKKPMKLSHDILPITQPHMHSWLNKYGRMFLYWYGTRAQLVITEPELIKEILNNKDGTYPKFQIEGYFKKLLGDGLVTVEGKKWITQRKIANHSFHADSLKGMVKAMTESVEMMLERWRITYAEGNNEIEAFQEFRVLTSEIISRTAFGSNYLEGKNIFDMISKLASLASVNSYKMKIPIIGKIFRSSDEIESDKLELQVRKSIIEIVRKKEEEMRLEGSNSSEGCDFLGLLIKATQETDEEKKISIDDVIDECKTFYFAGHETTTGLLAWTSLLLAINPEWQDKARKEATEFLNKNYSTPEFYSHIARSKTLNIIINETLRLYPLASSIGRRVSKKVRLGNLVLPPGVGVSIPVLAIHHDAEIWGEDVHVFKPERFSEGVAKATTNSANMAFLPFGYGPRTCVGLSFALLEVKIALLMILSRFHFALSPTYVHSPVYHPTLHAQHGIQITLHACL
ncbi:hypothetical protein Scep_007873 [Stephania cephalantha]|uniref:Cytochrome P450 n=1 Tax=Stephania cephalantha TaxID=152367 RepID=A0AAP0KAQ2_9MAGN